MGCGQSRVEKEETVWRCRERKRMMKQLISCRSELAAAYMAYLQSLKNTGATLRQFAETESDVLGNPHPQVTSPPSPPPPPPPPPLPPPPPPPHFSSLKKVMDVAGRSCNDDNASSVGIDTDDDDNESCIPPPPPLNSSTWNFWEPYGIPLTSKCSFSVTAKGNEMNVQTVQDEENWADASTEFGDEDDEEREGKGKYEDCDVETSLLLLKEKLRTSELTDVNSSTVSRITKESDTAAVVLAKKKTLLEIVKDIDDYFLQAAGGGSDLLLFLESTHGHQHESNFTKLKGRTSKSAKVLSWSWSLKSSHSNRDVCGQNCESFSPGKHHNTLEKIYAEEVKLYKEVKDDELAKVQLKRLISLLEKFETSGNDYTRSETLRSDIETLQTQILSLQESINTTCLSISKSRDEELHPQFLELLLGLSSMWRTMYECHQVQAHISQQENLPDNHPCTEPTTDLHRFATVQLENEVASWHSSFCKLLSCLREYSLVLDQWVRLTDCLPYSNNFPSSMKRIHSLCDEWKLALDQLPDKVTADSIKSLVSVIQFIVLQQNKELSLEKKVKRLSNRLEKKQKSISEAQNTPLDDHSSSSNVKLDALKKILDEEKANYLASVRVSRAMPLNNLHASLPNVFQALAGFSNACVQNLDRIVRPDEAAAGS